MRRAFFAWPRGLSAEEAAEYAGGAKVLKELEGLGLKPTLTGHKRTTYDRRAIDNYMDQLSLRSGVYLGDS